MEEWENVERETSQKDIVSPTSIWKEKKTKKMRNKNQYYLFLMIFSMLKIDNSNPLVSMYSLFFFLMKQNQINSS